MSVFVQPASDCCMLGGLPLSELLLPVLASLQD